MVNFWKKIRNTDNPASRVQVDAVQQREVAEATRQRLERAIASRKAEINGLVDGVIPKRGTDQ